MGIESKHKSYESTLGRQNGGKKFVPYENLANAVIKKAVRDWQNAIIALHLNPNDDRAYRQKNTIERFFRSNWYRTLTNMDGEKLLKLARKQVEDNNWQRFDMSQD